MSIISSIFSGGQNTDLLGGYVSSALALHRLSSAWQGGVGNHGVSLRMFSKSSLDELG